MKRKTLVLDKNEFKDAVERWENYQIERGNANELNFISPLENIQIMPIKDTKTGETNLMMDRKLILNDHEYESKRIKISDKYLPITLPEIFKHIHSNEHFEQLIQQIDKVELFTDSGSMKIHLQEQHLDKQVLNVKLLKKLSDRKSYDFMPTDLEINQEPFGNYHPIINIENSFNKMKAFTVSMGMLRLICMNGMTSFRKSFGESKKHFKSNGDIFGRLIDDSLNQIPKLNSLPFNDEFDMELSDEDKDLYVIKLNDWYKNKKETETYKNDKAVKHTIDRMKDVYEYSMKLPEMHKIIDFTNFNSFFETPKYRSHRFSTTINGVARQLRFLLNEVKPEAKAINF